MSSRIRSLTCSLCLLTLMVALFPSSIVHAAGTPPSTPTDVTASVVDEHIVISWGDLLDTGGSSCNFEIFRGTLPYDTSPGTSYPVHMSLLHRTQQGAYSNSYTDTTAQPGQHYCYYVVAVNSYGESEPSNMVTVTAPTSPPPSYYTPPASNNAGVPLIFPIFAFMVVVVIIGSVFAWRRKRKVPPSPPQEQTQVQ